MIPKDIQKIPSPCFLLEEQRLINNLKLLQGVQESAGVDIILALKGFALWKVFPLISKYLKGATASSLNEVLLCKEEMKAKAHTYAVAYSENEIDEMLANSSHITFNSLEQFHMYSSKARSVSCGLRINPEKSDVKAELYNPSDPGSRLGLTSDQMPYVLPDGIEGLHFHTLCESDSYALEKVLNAVESKFQQYLKKIKWLNLGGGHAITRKDYDIDHLIRLLNRIKQTYNLQIIMEPGSAVAWETGELYTTILDIVKNNKTQTAIIDASFTCHMPDCLEMPYRPNIRGGYVDENHANYKYRIGGLSCLAGDYLDSYSFDKELKVGDKIVFEDMMHYTMVKTTTFNGIQHPAIAIRKKSGEVEIVRKFHYADYKNRLS
ncbi:MAG: carboxynorspermidine decarboxylase [Cyclobacteriaceae bacterium]